MELNINARERLARFIASSRRVFVIAKKPDLKEFQNMALVTGIGIVVIAIIGYVIQLIFGLLGMA